MDKLLRRFKLHCNNKDENKQKPNDQRTMKYQRNMNDQRTMKYQRFIKFKNIFKNCLKYDK